MFLKKYLNKLSPCNRYPPLRMVSFINSYTPVFNCRFEKIASRVSVTYKTIDISSEQQMIRLDSMLASEGITRPENPIIFPNVSRYRNVFLPLIVLLQNFLNLFIKFQN